MELKRKKFISIHHDSMLDFDFDYYMNTDRENRDKFRSLYNSRVDRSWTGPTITSTRDAFDKAMIGDHEMYNKHLLPKINQLNKLLYDENDLDNINTVPVVRRRRTRSDFGDELDIQYVLRGQLDRAWQTTERVEFDQGHHLITLLIDIGGLSNIQCLHTLWNAAASLKICDDLQKSGKNIQIIVGNTSRNVTRSGCDLSMSYTVKKYNEHLSVERLAAMTHIGFYRTMGFLAKATSSKSLRSGLGATVSFRRNNLPIHIQDELKTGKTKVVVLNRCLDIHSARNAINTVYKHIKDNSTGLAFT